MAEENSPHAGRPLKGVAHVPAQVVRSGRKTGRRTDGMRGAGAEASSRAGVCAGWDWSRNQSTGMRHCGPVVPVADDGWGWASSLHWPPLSTVGKRATCGRLGLHTKTGASAHPRPRAATPLLRREGRELQTHSNRLPPHSQEESSYTSKFASALRT